MTESELIQRCEIEHLRYNDELHLFEVGDFYEIRGIEATEVAPLLNLPISTREYDASIRYKERVAIVGFPKNDGWYRGRLRKKGYYFIFLGEDYGKNKEG